MSEFPMVPSYLGGDGYGALPKPIAEVLERSGVIGYLTYNEDGKQAFDKLAAISTRMTGRDMVTAQIDPELFIRAMCAGWTRMVLNETATNSVASTADEYYKGLFAARAKEEEERKQKPQPSNITTSGMRGFSEESAPEDWDMAIGQILGFRKWSILPSAAADVQDVLKGSYGKNFLDHYMNEDGRRKASCHAGGSKHPADEVPADNGCGCGWWAYWAPEEAQKHGGDGGLGSINVTIGVEGTGRVVIGQKGFRSQYVRVTGIAPDHPVEDLSSIKAFSRRWLLDAPVYGTVEELRDGVGTDPTYGTLAARYPEIARHDNRALAVYAWFLAGVQGAIALHMGKLTDRIQHVAPTTLYGSEAAKCQEELSEEHSYLQTSHDLLGLERKTVERIIIERGATADELVRGMGGSGYSSPG